MFRKQLSTIVNLGRIVYLSVLVGVALPAGAAWAVLIRPTRPSAWVSVAVSCVVGIAIALLANVAERFVDRRAERSAARAKAVS